MRHYVLTIFMIMLRLCSECPVAPPSLSLSCSFRRLNAAVKPFSVSVALFFMWRSLLGLGLGFGLDSPAGGSAPLLTALTTVENPHTMRLQATKTEMNIAFHSIFYMSIQRECQCVCVCVICVWLLPRSKVWHAKVLTICCQLANFLVITDSTLNYTYVNVCKRRCVCVRVCV